MKKKSFDEVRNENSFNVLKTLVEKELNGDIDLAKELMTAKHNILVSIDGLKDNNDIISEYDFNEEEGIKSRDFILEEVKKFLDKNEASINIVYPDSDMAWINGTKDIKPNNKLIENIQHDVVNLKTKLMTYGYAMNNKYRLSDAYASQVGFLMKMNEELVYSCFAISALDYARYCKKNSHR